MNAGYLALLAAAAPVFVALGVGFALRRARWLTGEADASLMRVSFNVLYPCFIADAVLGNPTLERTDNIVIPPVLGFVLLAISLGIALAAARALRLPPKSAGSFAFATALLNWGFLPIPLVETLYGKETLGVLFTFNLGFEIAMWTVGVWVLTGAAGERAWARILNIPACAILLAIGLNFAGAREWLPTFFLKSIHLLGRAAIPLSLLLSGATLADQMREPSTGEDCCPRPTLPSALFLRLALLPVMILAVARWLPIGREIKQVLIVQAAMPSALMPILLARHHGADAGLALRIVLSTTLLGLLTIPFWLRIGAWWVAP